MELPFTDIVNISLFRDELRCKPSRVNESLRETIHREEHIIFFFFDEKISHSDKLVNQLRAKIQYIG